MMWLAATLLFFPLQAVGPVRQDEAGGYWQQDAVYTIEAELDEGAELLRAAAIFAYRNRSPDTLDVLYFHLYLNAFRPNSLWARTEQRPAFDFQSLPPEDQAFQRLTRARAGGTDLAAEYPYAPDSTVVRLALPVPLAPGDSVVLELEWEARPSTLCRRQCRSGRHYDFAQWYPRIAVYDRGGWQAHPLYPQGEFYGEFARYDVTLDLAADQVVGATGVPLSGDPGWRSASSSSAPEPMYQRAWYGVVAPPRSPPRLFRSDEAAPGRKRVRFYAEQVHHFAWSVDPAFLYEGGLLEARTSDADPVEISIHVLYRPGDEATWGGGIALERTIGALRWLEEVFGSYPYPQLTNLHRLEGGGTEFPMLVMNGSASEGLIFHEVSHQYVHGILANNEWREAWLDEGFAEFLTTWFQERQVGPGVWTRKLERAAMLERSGIAEPVGTPAEEFSSFPMYGAMAYTKASLIFRMLRELLGEDAFRLLLREYYARYRLRHVTEDDLRGLADKVSGRSLGWFFDAWLHGTETLDYAIGGVEMEVRADGTWRTFVEIHRLGGIWMPIAVRVDDVVVMAESREPRQLVEVVTRQRPRIVELDPAALLLEADRSNNRVRTGR